MLDAGPAGCADTSLLHDGAFGWAKWAIDANRGEWPAIPPGPSGGPEPLRGRIQLELADLADGSALYVAEGQMVSGHDQQLGQGANSASRREVSFANAATPTSVGPTNLGEPAIFAWKSVHADVRLTPLAVRDEGGPGIHGLYWLGSRATDLGNGTWRYDYAVQNLSSERAARGLVLDTPCGAVPTSSHEFRGVPQHSGSPYADAVWTFARSGSSLRRTTSTFASDPDANALRWGSLFAFRVEPSAAPRIGTARRLLFEGGRQLFAGAWVPGPDPCPLPLPPSRAARASAR